MKKQHRKTIVRLKKELRALRAQLDKKNTKEDRIKEAWDLPELTDSMMKLLDEQGFRTGSTVYSGVTLEEATDIDICIVSPPKMFVSKSGGAHATGVDGERDFEYGGFSSLYAHHDGQLYNILCFNDHSLFEAWHHTTQLMISLKLIATRDYVENQDQLKYCMASRLNQKWCRVRLFQALRDVMWEPIPLREPIPVLEAVRRGVCSCCGREATHFTDAPAERHYNDTGICQRCTSEVMTHASETSF